MRRLWRRIGPIILFLCFASTAPAYYYYVHFPNSNGPFTPIPEKFDVNSLPNQTLNFFVADSGPAAYYPGDSMAAIVSEIRAAASTWNAVGNSALRLAYGGLYTAGSQGAAPSIDVQFSADIPPGVLALGGPRSTGTLINSGNGAFVPIQHSSVVLPADLSQTPSFSEAFFVTLVHEFGHALGLQHTFSSSAMSTQWTSASSKAMPLGADDIAGISLLYGAKNYLASVGSLSGRVTMHGSGVNLASVVALPAVGPAISALTNPDGTYQITGLAPGVPYFVYAHPLPPALGVDGSNTPGNITFPVDAKGNSSAFQPNYTAFLTQFYPNTSDPTAAVPISVGAGGTVTGIDFKVTVKNSQAVSAVRTYGYSATNVPQPSPDFWVNLNAAAMIAEGPGLLNSDGSKLTPGLDIEVFQQPGLTYNLQPYYGTALFYIQPGVNYTVYGPGPRHLLFLTPNDLYVLPSGYLVTNNQPPSINSITPGFDANGNRVLTITGSNFFQDSRVYFDGVPGTIEALNSDGSLVVAPPPAAPGYTAPIAVLNSDGQSSLLLQGNNPSTYTYDSGPGSTSLSFSPGFLSPGVDTVVSVTATGATPFVDGQTAVGFGTSDVLVKKVTVIDSNHLSVLVTASTFTSINSINITTGLRILASSQGTALQAQNR